MTIQSVETQGHRVDEECGERLRRTGKRIGDKKEREKKERDKNHCFYGHLATPFHTIEVDDSNKKVAN